MQTIHPPSVLSVRVVVSSSSTIACANTLFVLVLECTANPPAARAITASDDTINLRIDKHEKFFPPTKKYLFRTTSKRLATPLDVALAAKAQNLQACGRKWRHLHCFFLPSRISPPRHQKNISSGTKLVFWCWLFAGQITKSRVARQGNFARKTIRRQNFHIRHEFDFFFRYPNLFFQNFLFCASVCPKKGQEEPLLLLLWQIRLKAS